MKHYPKIENLHKTIWANGVWRMHEHEKIDYVELPASNLQKTKEFFTQAFGWSFQDFGPEYSAFSNQGLDGGFYKADSASSASNGSAWLDSNVLWAAS